MTMQYTCIWQFMRVVVHSGQSHPLGECPGPIEDARGVSHGHSHYVWLAGRERKTG